MGGRDKVVEFRERLICKNIVLVMGNHDIHIIKNAVLPYKKGFINAKELFKSTHDILEKKWAQQRFVLCHYPMYSWHKIGRSIHLYGHTHEELNYNKYAVCVCMDVHPEFRPFKLSEILNIIDERKKHVTSYVQPVTERD